MASPDEITVVVDARCLNQTHVRGMGKYLISLVEAMSRIGHYRWHMCGDRPDLNFELPQVPEVYPHVFEWPGYRFHTWEQLGLPRRAAALHADMIHAPATSLPWWQPVPTVVTLHDTITWSDADTTWPPGWYRDRLLPSALAKCAVIITGSENSRMDIEHRWPGLGGKIEVIPHGIDDRYRNWQPERLTDNLERLGVRRPYLLYVGGEIPRKRPEWAVRVAAATEVEDAVLVMCGVTPEGRVSLMDAMDARMRTRVVFMPFVAEDDMAALYGNAAAVLYPTLYEGFGFPMVEAQAVGTPVLFSVGSSLRELKGPAAIPLGVEDLGAWVSVCRQMLASRGSDGRPDGESREWANRFSWGVAAARTVAVYARAMGQGR